MRRASILTMAVSSVALMAVAAVGAVRWAATSTDRPDCPGKIVCPQTGQLVCRDQCSTVDPDRSDCPGRIACPQTGDLVCVDRCPLGSNAELDDETLPPCCRGGK